MALDDIGAMIADTLEALEDAPPASGGVRTALPASGGAGTALPHGHVILEQYAALCRTDDAPEVEASAAVALPVPEAAEPPTPARGTALASAVRKVIARVRR